MFRWLQTSSVLARVKPLLPDTLKAFIKKVVVSNGCARIELGGGAVFEYGLRDNYWHPVASDIRNYEPEVRFVIDRFVDGQTLFIDAGANLGIWSCYVGAKIRSKQQVIAIEPNSAILPCLRRNQEINGQSFTVLERAVWKESRRTLSFSENEHHESSRLHFHETDAPGNRKVISVSTISIDEIVQDALRHSPQISKVIVKLDVEGAEISALQGANVALSGKNVLLLYEDHGRDIESRVTNFLLSELAFIVYCVDTRSPQWTVWQVQDTRELVHVKTSPVVGYNFFACKLGSVFDAEFRAMCEGRSRVNAV